MKSNICGSIISNAKVNRCLYAVFYVFYCVSTINEKFFHFRCANAQVRNYIKSSWVNHSIINNNKTCDNVCRQSSYTFGWNHFFFLQLNLTINDMKLRNTYNTIAKMVAFIKLFTWVHPIGKWVVRFVCLWFEILTIFSNVQIANRKPNEASRECVTFYRLWT